MIPIGTLQWTARPWIDAIVLVRRVMYTSSGRFLLEMFNENMSVIWLRLLSHHTIEENIFHKQLQKRMLDDVVVDEGAFTTQTIIKWTGVDVADMLEGVADDSTSTADLLKMTSNDIQEAMEGVSCWYQ